MQFRKACGKIRNVSRTAISYARVAQLVEYDLAKVGVAGSSPVSRSQRTRKKVGIHFGYPPSFLRSSPAGLERFEVSTPFRSSQSERPLDVLRRLALSEKFEVSTPFRSSQSERPLDVLRRLALSFCVRGLHFILVVAKRTSQGAAICYVKVGIF